MKLSKETHAEVQLVMLAKLEELGIDIHHPDFGMVIMLVESNGHGGQKLHLGAYNLEDAQVIDMLEQAPECVRKTSSPLIVPTKPAVS